MISMKPKESQKKKKNKTAHTTNKNSTESHNKQKSIIRILKATIEK